MSMERHPEDQAPSGEGPQGGKPPRFFSSPQLTQCTDLLRHLTENTHLIPLVTGGKGAGKTTLLFQFQSLAPENWSVCRVDANPMLHPEQLLSQLARHFGVPEEDDRLEEHLLEHFSRLRHDGILPVVAVDDAHLLPPATVAALLQLHAHTEEGDPLLRIVLFALPGIDALLQTPEIKALNPKDIHSLEIPRLTREQTGAYITHALAARGALEAFALTPGQVDKIHRASQGVPGRIEHLLTKLPAHPATPRASSGRPKFGLLLEDLPAPALLGGLGLIAVILLLLIFQDEINSLFTGSAPPEKLQAQTEETATAQKELPLELPPPVPEQPPAEMITSPPPPPGGPAPVEAEEPEPIREIPEKPAPEEPAEEAAGTEAATPAAPQAPPPTAGAPPATEKIETKPVPEPKPPAPPPEKTVRTPPPKPPAPEKPAAETRKAPAPRKTGESARREAWLLSRKPTAYTLQLIGLRDEPAIREFIKRHGLEGKAAYFKTSRGGRPWFPLLYGIYPDRKAAIAARSRLPRKLRRPDIWVRSLESVQTEIRAR